MAHRDDGISLLATLTSYKKGGPWSGIHFHVNMKRTVSCKGVYFYGT